MKNGNTRILGHEQFEKSRLKLCAAVGKVCGNFDIYVNGNFKASQDLFSSHQGITNPYVDLGENEPRDNAFTIRFVLKEANANSNKVNGKYALGIDFFLIENNFLTR